MKKTMTFFALLLAVLCLLTSCYEVSINNQIKSDVLQLSFQKSSSSTKAIPKYYKLQIGDDIDYKEAIVNGTFVASLTPENFIMAINKICLYNPKDASDPTSGVYGGIQGYPDNQMGGEQPVFFSPNVHFIMNPDNINGAYIPNRINMLHTKGMAASSNVGRSPIWHGLYFDTFSGGERNVNKSYIGDRVGIKKSDLVSLGIEIERIANSEELTYSFIDDDDDCIWFSCRELFPFIGNATSGQFYLLMQDGLEEPMIYTHTGGPCSDAIFGPAYYHPNATFVALPMDTLDFSSFLNPELELSVDATDLISIYEYDGGYYFYFDKENPFPYTVKAKEFSFGNHNGTSLLQDEALMDCVRIEFDSLNTIFQFRRPNFDDIAYIEIYGSNGNSLSSAKRIGMTKSNVYIYSGLKKYRNYWGCFVDSTGKRSAFKEFPLFSFDGEGYQGLPNPIIDGFDLQKVGDNYVITPIEQPVHGHPRLQKEYSWNVDGNSSQENSVSIPGGMNRFHLVNFSLGYRENTELRYYSGSVGLFLSDEENDPSLQASDLNIHATLHTEDGGDRLLISGFDDTVVPSGMRNYIRYCKFVEKGTAEDRNAWRNDIVADPIKEEQDKIVQLVIVYKTDSFEKVYTSDDIIIPHK